MSEGCFVPTIPRKSGSWLLAVLGGLLLAGCASLTAPQESPEVFLVDVSQAKEPGGLLEQRVTIDLRIRNPNDRELTITGLDFFLDVNGTRLARGLSNQTVTVPRLGEAMLSVTASTTIMDMVRQLTKLTQSQDFTYAVKGHIHLDHGWASRLPFESAGTLLEPAK